MNISSIAVKKTAITALKGRYLSALITATIYIFACLICMICRDTAAPFLGSALTPVFSLALIIFLMIPLTLGLVFFSVRIVFCGEAHPLLLFNFFTDKNSYIRAMKFALPFMLKTVISGVILFIPCFAVDLLASGKLFTLFGAQIPLWTSSLWGVSVVLRVLAFIVLILVMLKYYLAPFLLVADNDMDPLEAMHISRIIAKRSKKDFLFLIFSFAFYILACVFVVPIIFIIPYFAVAYAVHCRFTVAAHNKIADSMNLPEVPSFDADISF